MCHVVFGLYKQIIIHESISNIHNHHSIYEVHLKTIESICAKKITLQYSALEKVEKIITDDR